MFEHSLRGEKKTIKTLESFSAFMYNIFFLGGGVGFEPPTGTENTRARKESLGNVHF